MPSEFASLIAELKQIQAKRLGGERLRKALPAGGDRISLPEPTAQDLKRMARRLEMMTKSLGVQRAASARRTRQEKQEEFLKSFSALNDRIGSQIAAGNLTAHEACVLTAKLHHLGDRVGALLAEGGR
jgi:hypothetical protein